MKIRLKNYKIGHVHCISRKEYNTQACDIHMDFSDADTAIQIDLSEHLSKKTLLDAVDSLRKAIEKLPESLIPKHK